jgi:hypothetical protein
MSKLWVELLYFDGVGVQNTYGTIEGTVEDSILNKADNEWVRLNNARHLDETGTRMEKLEDDIVGTEHFMYLRARSIMRVTVIRSDVTFWQEGRAPIDSISESDEDH